MLSTDQIIQMCVEVMSGKPPTITTAEADQMREALRHDIATIREKGGIVDLPDYEWDPDNDSTGGAA